MTPPVFPGSLPSMYYSLNITGTIIVVFYIIVVDVIIIYPKPISCHRNGRAHRNLLT